MSQIAEIITAGATALTTVGGGIAFVIHRYDRRFESVEKELKACRARETEMRETAATYLLVIELLWQLASKTKAAAPVLARCKKHLDDLKQKAKEMEI